MSAVVTSAAPFVTDERLAHLTPWVLFLIVGLLVLALVWMDHGKPWVADEDEAPVAAPPTAPDIDSFESLRRASDRS